MQNSVDSSAPVTADDVYHHLFAHSIAAVRSASSDRQQQLEVQRQSVMKLLGDSHSTQHTIKQLTHRSEALLAAVQSSDALTRQLQQQTSQLTAAIATQAERAAIAERKVGYLDGQCAAQREELIQAKQHQREEKQRHAEEAAKHKAEHEQEIAALTANITALKHASEIAQLKHAADTTAAHSHISNHKSAHGGVRDSSQQSSRVVQQQQLQQQQSQQQKQRGTQQKSQQNSSDRSSSRSGSNGSSESRSGVSDADRSSDPKQRGK